MRLRWRKDCVQKLFYGLNLFTVVEALQDDELWFDHLNKVVEFGTFQLGDEGFYDGVSWSDPR